MSAKRGQCRIAAALMALPIAQRAMAQPGAERTAPNALQGFQQNRGQPVQIEASRLEVRDKDKIATFSGNVKVVQGDTTMRCKVLVVFYEQPSKDGQQVAAAVKTMPAAKPGPGGSSQISKLEASGGVTVTQKDQTATGDTRPVRHEIQHRDADGQCAGQPGSERHARRKAGGRSDHRRVAGRCRQSGPVRMLIQQGPPQDKACASGRANSVEARPTALRTEWTSGARR